MSYGWLDGTGGQVGGWAGGRQKGAEGGEEMRLWIDRQTDTMDRRTDELIDRLMNKLTTRSDPPHTLAQTRPCPNTATPRFLTFWLFGNIAFAVPVLRAGCKGGQSGCHSMGVAAMPCPLVSWCVCGPVGHHSAVMDNSIFAAGVPLPILHLAQEGGRKGGKENSGLAVAGRLAGW